MSDSGTGARALAPYSQHVVHSDILFASWFSSAFVFLPSVTIPQLVAKSASILVNINVES